VSAGRAWATAAFALVAPVAFVACSKGGEARYPRRPVGCEVKMFHGTPDVPTVNIGPVRARCAEDIPRDDCLRTLMDTVCDLGGDVVWGVDESEHTDGKVRYSGRAAHTKAPKPPTATP
jgi:hypothetical protein